MATRYEIEKREGIRKVKKTLDELRRKKAKDILLNKLVLNIERETNYYVSAKYIRYVIQGYVDAGEAFIDVGDAPPKDRISFIDPEGGAE